MSLDFRRWWEWAHVVDVDGVPRSFVCRGSEIVDAIDAELKALRIGDEEGRRAVLLNNAGLIIRLARHADKDRRIKQWLAAILGYWHT